MGKTPATYEQLQAAISEALRWLDVDNASGTGYVNRIWYAKAALQKVSCTPLPASSKGDAECQ